MARPSSPRNRTTLGRDILTLERLRLSLAAFELEGRPKANALRVQIVRRIDRLVRELRRLLQFFPKE